MPTSATAAFGTLLKLGDGGGDGYRLVASAVATKGRFGGFGWASAVDEYILFQGTWAPPAEAGGSKLGPGDLKVRPRRTSWKRG